jgi:undecaprenyl-diphosphatase
LALGWNVFVALIVVLTVVSFVLLDAPLQYLLRQDIGNLQEFFGYVTRFGSSDWVLWGCGVAVIGLSFLNWSTVASRSRTLAREVFADALFALSATAVSGTAVSLIKNTIGRARPRYLDELGPFHFDFAAFDASFASFPSGHSTTFGAVAMTGALLLPRAWPVFLVLGALGGVSRAFVGAHYISDILVGLAFGAIFTLLMARWLARKGLMFRCEPGQILPRRRRLLRPRLPKGRAPDHA